MATSSDYAVTTANLFPRASISSIRSEDQEGLLAATKEHYRDEPNTPRRPTPPQSPTRNRHPLSICARILSVMPWILVGMILAWMMSAFFYQVKPFKADITILQESTEGAELKPTHNDTLPSRPMPVIVKDQEGRSRWTISLPASLEYPLMPQQYSELCEEAHKVSKHLDTSVHNGPGHYPYYHVDENFLEIPEAEELGLLPTNPVLKYSSHWSASYDTGDSLADSAGYCKRSLTYVLETPDAGLGPMLMELWAAYGLAREEERAFFVDDRNWAYGKWTDYFQPPPEDGCLPPPDNHMLPCPRTTNHLVVSHSMQSFVFGYLFNAEYEDPKKMRVQRQHKIFALMRTGYEALFHLADSDQTFLQARLEELDADIRERGGLEIGVHVRHGDRHPLQFQYAKDYVPLEVYADAARVAAEPAINTTRNRRDIYETPLGASKIILASDDPLTYTSSELKMAIPAQTRVELARQPPLDPSAPSSNGSAWMGGFTAEKFWQLGDPHPATQPDTAQVARHLAMHHARFHARHLRHASSRLPSRDVQDGTRTTPSSEALRLRSLVARSYLLDLAVLGQADRVVCTVSSVGCRILAIMMGWEQAIDAKHWINVDGQWEWSGIRW